MSKIWDISQLLRPGLPVWPGDSTFETNAKWVLDSDCPVNVGQFQLSTHSGTHADAPLHYDPMGLAIADVDLDIYIGPCVLIDAICAKGQVEPEDIADQLPNRVERVLLRTYAAFPHDHWVEKFTSVAPATIDLIASRGARLIGIDSPSLDPQTSKTLDAHHAAHRCSLAILEGLVLDGVPPGNYELIAPPLKLKQLDASPVRALLRSI
ncbi:Kynurenine formamidase, bacterial [Marinobacterium lacunae]|uniref:Kynurenine formamidase n=1 Tax=Marinobacterium lacunae TaxID=1232683 RepID=A0A081G3Z6_9GAMM|nr:arylformamidase [Marinobacterium lacunae]KEA65501.1 Kynurenine formamidase, bacterial [Marinobacterium lacunae]